MLSTLLEPVLPRGRQGQRHYQSFSLEGQAHLPPFLSPSGSAPHSKRGHRCPYETALLTLFSCVLSTTKGRRARPPQRSFSEEEGTFLIRAVGAGAVERVGVGGGVGEGTGRRASPSSSPQFSCPFRLEAGAEPRCPGLRR